MGGAGAEAEPGEEEDLGVRRDVGGLTGFSAFACCLFLVAGALDRGKVALEGVSKALCEGGGGTGGSEARN